MTCLLFINFLVILNGSIRKKDQYLNENHLSEYEIIKNQDIRLNETTEVLFPDSLYKNNTQIQKLRKLNEDCTNNCTECFLSDYCINSQCAITFHFFHTNYYYPENCKKSTKCDYGYFYKNETIGCIPCNAKNCKICENNTCTLCNDGYYYLKNSKKCVKCNIENCKICNTTTCEKCKDNYKLVDSNCIKCIDNCKKCDNNICDECNDGYYFNGSECLPCSIENCKKCKNGINCDLCNDGYKKVSNGKCINCGEVYNYTEGCQTCFDNRYTCFDCKTPFHLKNSAKNCNTEGFCKTGFYYKNSTLGCINYGIGCAEYKDDICISCKPGYKFDYINFKCIECEKGTYSFGNHSIICEDCNCDKDGCNPDTGVCKSNCKLGYNKNSLNLCVKCLFDENAKKEDQICRLPGDNNKFDKEKEYCKGVIPDNNTCSEIKGCIATPDGEYSLDGKESKNCNCEDNKCNKTSGECTEDKNCISGYYKDYISKLCVKCMNNCKKCSSSNSCDLCNDGFYFNGTLCEDCHCASPNDICIDGVCSGDCAEGNYKSTNDKCLDCEVSGCSKCIDGGSKCEECNTGFTLIQNECLFKNETDCALPCATCSKFDYCVTCKKDGFIPIDGICPSCMELHKGCSEDCTYDKCNKCLKYFTLNSEGKCDENKVSSIPLPKFELIGYGLFNKKGKKVKFKIYLRLLSGMMYRGIINFNLIINDSTNKKILHEITGTGIQVYTSTGQYSDNSTIKDYLVIFDCQVNDVPDFDNGLYISDLKILEYNEMYKEVYIPFKYEFLKNIDISIYTSNEIEYLYSNFGKLYIFTQKSKKSLNDLTRCTKRGDNGHLKIEGIIEGTAGLENSIHKIYDLKTNDGKIATCILNKKEYNPEATLECIIKNPRQNFYITNELGNATDYSNNHIIFNRLNLTFCNSYDIITLENENESTLSKEGLSNGIIAVFIIICFIIIGIVITFIFNYRYKNNNTYMRIGDDLSDNDMLKVKVKE